MKNKRNKIILFLLLTKSLVFADSFAENIELNKEYYELDVASEKMVVIDFPFKIADHQFLGDQDTISGDMRDKSLYLKITKGFADVTVWGGDKPVLITLKAIKDGKRRISFFENPNSVKEVKKEYKEWNHDIKIAEQIEVYSKKLYWLIEVTLIRNKTQQLNSETTSVIRHFLEDNKINNYLSKYLSFVAPFIHQDTKEFYEKI